MKITYRAAEYDYQPVQVEAADADATGYYRGQVAHYTYPRHVPQPVLNLAYRGVFYQAGPQSTEAIAYRPAAPRPVATPVKPTVFYSSKHRTEAAAESHRQAIQQRLQHRIQVATANGDNDLLHQLEQEMQSFA